MSKIEDLEQKLEQALFKNKLLTADLDDAQLKNARLKKQIDDLTQRLMALGH